MTTVPPLLTLWIYQSFAPNHRYCVYAYTDSKARGAHVSPTWSRQDPRWTNVGQWSLLSGWITRGKRLWGKTPRVFWISRCPWKNSCGPRRQGAMEPYSSACNKKNNDHFVYACSQWETTLQCNIVSHWLGAFTKWSLEKSRECIPGCLPYISFHR